MKLVSGSGGEGETYTLTNSPDNYTGGSGNDTFDGTLDDNGNVTFQAFDTLDGGDGTDQLITQGLTGTTTTNAQTLQNVENIKNYAMVNNATLALANTTGVQEVLVNNPAGNSNVTGINSGIKTVGVTGNATGAANTHTFTFSSGAVSGSEDTVALNLTGVGDSTTNDNVNLDPVSGTNGFETVNIDASSTASYVTLNDNTSNSLTTIEVPAKSRYPQKTIFNVTFD